MKRFRILLRLVLLALLVAPWYLAQGNLVLGTMDASTLVTPWFRLGLADPYASLSILAGSFCMVPVLGSGMLVLVIYTLVGARSFCSWVCPMGLLFDLLHRFFLPRPAKYKQLRTIKWLVFWGLLFASALARIPLWLDMNPIGILIRSLSQWADHGLLLVLGLLLMETLTRGDLFCRSLCPVGIGYSWLNFLGLFKIEIGSNCTRCRRCLKDCMASNELAQVILAGKGLVCSEDCTNCGNCKDRCPEKAVFFHFGRLKNSRQEKIQ